MAKSKKQTGETPEEQDPLAQALGPSPTEKFLEDNKALIGVALLALILIVGSSIFMKGKQDAALAEGGKAFSAANSIADFEKVAADYAGSVVAGNALIRKAALQEQEGLEAEAKETLGKFLADFAGHSRVPQAQMILARMAENAGELDEAEKLYSKVSLSESEMAALADMHLGDLEVQRGNIENAAKLYSEIIRKHPGHIWQGYVTLRVKRTDQMLAEAKKGAAPADEAKPTEETPAETAEPAESTEAAETTEPAESAETEEISPTENTNPTEQTEEAPAAGESDPEN